MEKMFRRIILIFVLLSFFLPAGLGAKDDKAVYLFYSKTCPHCQKELAYLGNLQKKYPDIKIERLEINSNYEFFEMFAGQYNSNTSGVPRTFVGDKVFIGFTENPGDLVFVDTYKAYFGYQNQIEKAIFDMYDIGKATASKKEGSPHPFWPLGLIALYLLSFAVPAVRKNRGRLHWWIAGLITTIIISLFLFILLTPDTEIQSFAASLPFPAFVFIISLADGFNPCAFTVLIILLSLLTYTTDKKAMAIIGGTFIAASLLMYFIFIMAMILFGNWAIERYGYLIMMILGIIVLIAGIINIKDFFFLEGISLSISDRHKKSFTKRAGKIVHTIKAADSWNKFILAVLATFILAVFVNLVELGCTAIFPAVYMVSLLQSYPDNLYMQVFWTIFYASIYVIPLLVILVNFIYTFKSTRLSEKQGRILKLVSGIFMITFGILMIFKPQILMFS